MTAARDPKQICVAIWERNLGHLGSSATRVIWDHSASVEIKYLGGLWVGLGEVSGRTLRCLWEQFPKLLQVRALRGLLHGLWEVSERFQPWICPSGLVDACQKRLVSKSKQRASVYVHLFVFCWAMCWSSVADYADENNGKVWYIW